MTNLCLNKAAFGTFTLLSTLTNKTQKLFKQIELKTEPAVEDPDGLLVELVLWTGITVVFGLSPSAKYE